MEFRKKALMKYQEKEFLKGFVEFSRQIKIFGLHNRRISGEITEAIKEEHL